MFCPVLAGYCCNFDAFLVGFDMGCFPVFKKDFSN